MPKKYTLENRSLNLETLDPNILKKEGFTEMAPGLFYQGESRVVDRKRLPWGKGEMVYLNIRSRYLGEWVKGDFEGQGTLYELNRTTYTGSFKDSKRHGVGQQQTASGAILKGTWFKGNLTFPCIKISTDGTETQIDEKTVGSLLSSIGKSLKLTREEVQQFQVTFGALSPQLQKLLTSEELTRGAINIIESKDRDSLEEAYTRIQRLMLLEEDISPENNRIIQREEQGRAHLLISEDRGFEEIVHSEQKIQRKFLITTENEGRSSLEEKMFTFFTTTTQEQKTQQMAIDPILFKKSQINDETIAHSVNNFGAIGEKESESKETSVSGWNPFF